MPSPHRRLTPDAVRRFVEEECFSTTGGRVGAEIEWITSPVGLDPAPFEVIRRTLDGLDPLPGGSRLTYEPGGQIELSSVAGASVEETCTRLALDEAEVRASLEPLNIAMTGIGLDPIRGHSRVVHLPRYAAMETYFDSAGPEGRRMMCRTAAVQVNLDSGLDEAARTRWSRMHTIGPVLAAMFSNSPFLEGRSTGWHSTRLATWWAMDRSRTRPARGEDPIEAWTSYLLNAHVMFVRVRPDWFEPIARPMTFAEWMEYGHPQGFPSIDDLSYHTTTVFPPVRPRGWLELRMIDALPDPWWRAAVAITAALIDDDDAGERASEACRRTSGMWLTASRCGLEDRSLASAARTTMTAALEGISRSGVDAVTERAALTFADRFTFRGRSPADDHLETWASTGRLPGEAAHMESAWS